MLTPEQIAQAKKRGFLRNRDTDLFSARIVTAGGVFTAAQLHCIANCAEKFGTGKITFTSRQSAEVPGLPFAHLNDMEQKLLKDGLLVGGTGPTVRPVVACKGTVCTFGNIDTQHIAACLHERLYIGYHQVTLPHKFKIAVGGCGNSCVKPSINDLGFEGCKLVEFDTAKCLNCDVCSAADACHTGALSCTHGEVSLNTELCVNCGMCARNCKGQALSTQSRVRVYVGGTWGRSWRVGKLLPFVIQPDEVPDFAEKTVLWYKANGQKKERFALTLERVGLDVFMKAVSTDDLIQHKKQIIEQPVLEKES